MAVVVLGARQYEEDRRRARGEGVYKEGVSEAAMGVVTATSPGEGHVAGGRGKWRGGPTPRVLLARATF